MSVSEMNEWNVRLQTPVMFNHHEPYEVNSTSISSVDLNPIKSTPKALSNHERVLILTPLRDAAPYLPKYFDLLTQLTYPHDLIDLAFLVGDCEDDTLAVLSAELDRVQGQVEQKVAFRSALIVQKDFGIDIEMAVEDKHSYKAQGPRRKAMGRARNYLLSSALKADHSWVYWRDVDIVDSPSKILEDFMAHDKDILVPSMRQLAYTLKVCEVVNADYLPDIWFHRYENGRDIEGKCKPSLYLKKIFFFASWMLI